MEVEIFLAGLAILSVVAFLVLALTSGSWSKGRRDRNKKQLGPASK